MSSRKKIAIIGAGASGLTAIKCCLDEDIDPICFERTDCIGGLWNYTEEAHDGQACVMKSTVINTSKEMMCYSDFPIPKEFPVFMHNSFVQKYFNLYADKFHLRKYIQFKTEVVHIKKSKDFEKTGSWDIQTRDIVSNQESDQIFDGVMICTGHHADKNLPVFNGLDKFKGKIIHSHDYRNMTGYENKRIIIIGIGNSGGDAAVELSRVAKQVFLSTRRGSWIVNRIDDYGVPVDMQNTTRFYFWLIEKIAPKKIIDFLIENHLNRRFDHAMFSLKPNHRPFAQHPTVNDDLPNRIISGSIIIKPDVGRFTESGVEFDDGTKEDDIDVVFLATGYKFGFPFLDKSVLEVKNNKVDLYKYVFPPDLTHQTLAVIGCIQPLGAIMPISEQQCRLFTRVLKGDAKLPSKEEMRQDVRYKAEEMAKRYVSSPRHTLQVDYVTYMNELATLNGNFYSMDKAFFRDPRLAIACYFGPCTPYQYRLVGPGKWNGAREAIMTQWERTVYPLKTRPPSTKERPSQMNFFLFYFVFVVVFGMIIHFVFMR